MLSKIIKVKPFKMTEVNGVTTSFYIEARPIRVESEDDAEIDLSKEISWDVVNSAPIISDFQTLLFPNNQKVEDAFWKLADMFENFDQKDADEMQAIRDAAPVINLARFSVDAPKPYFRRYVNSYEGVRAGDYIVAEGKDEFLPNDPYKRKLFKTISVTSLVRIDEHGREVAVENLNRKAARQWTTNLEVNKDSGFPIFEIVEDVMKREAVRERKALSPAQKEETNDAPQFSRRG